MLNDSPGKEYEENSRKLKIIDQCHSTVEGEFGVASFLIIFSGVHFQALVAVHPCPSCTASNCHRRAKPILAHSTPHAQVYKYSLMTLHQEKNLI